MSKAEYTRHRVKSGPNKGKEVYDHRSKVGAKPGQVVHHKDGVKRNNAKSNLAPKSRSKHQALENKKRAK